MNPILPGASAPSRIADMSIDELARAAGTTVRNVRAYQDRGLIAPPLRRGRKGLYTETHLARLRIIGDLLGRGYTLANIAELLSAWEAGHALEHVIGVETALVAGWSDELPMLLPYAEAVAMLGVVPTPEQLSSLVSLGYVALEGDRIRVTSPRMFRAVIALVRAGVPLSALLRQAAVLRIDVERIADGIARMMIESLVDPYGKGTLPPAAELPRLIDAVRDVRPLAQTVVDVELARALEKVAARCLGDRLLAVLKPGLAPDRA